MFNGGEHAPALTEDQRTRANAWLPETMSPPDRPKAKARLKTPDDTTEDKDAPSSSAKVAPPAKPVAQPGAA